MTTLLSVLLSKNVLIRITLIYLCYIIICFQFYFLSKLNTSFLMENFIINTKIKLMALLVKTKKTDVLLNPKKSSIKGIIMVLEFLSMTRNLLPECKGLI